MRDLREKSDGGRVVRIAEREFEFQVKNATLIESSFWPSDVGMPSEQITLKRSCGDTHSRYFFLLYFLIILHESFVGECL